MVKIAFDYKELKEFLEDILETDEDRCGHVTTIRYTMRNNRIFMLLGNFVNDDKSRHVKVKGKLLIKGENE